MNDYSTASQQNELKIYPGLARAAAAADLSRQCRWWHILRGVASRRAGWQWFEVGQVVAIFAQYGLSRRQAYDLFDGGSGIFFEVNRSRGVVALVGLVRACEALGCSAGRPVALPIEQIAGRLTAWKAAVYALGFASKARNISRRRLQTETGAAPSTQRRYEAQTGVKKMALFEFAPIGVKTSIPEGAPWWHVNHNGIDGVAWPTVNQYVLHRDTRKISPVRCRRGMSRKARISPANGDGVHVRYLHDKRPLRQPHDAYGVLDNGSGFEYYRHDGRRVAGRVYVRVYAQNETRYLPQSTLDWYASNRLA